MTTAKDSQTGNLRKKIIYLLFFLVMAFSAMIIFSDAVAAQANITFNKNSYSVSEVMNLQMIGDNDTYAEVYYKPTGTLIYSLLVNITNSTTSTSINKAATYDIKIEIYENGTTNATKVSESHKTIIVTSFDLKIEVPKKIVAQNNQLTMTASQTGAVGAVTYEWYFNDGTGTIKTGSSVTHLFSNLGTHTIQLNAKDSLDNQKNATINITVQSAHRVWVEVISEKTGEYISDAQVDISGDQSYTDSMGRSLFNLAPSTYVLTVKKSKYQEVKRYIDVTKEETYKVFLTKYENERIPPSIITNTLDRETINSTSANLELEIYDENFVACDVYIKRRGSEWKYVTSFNVSGGTNVYSVPFRNLRELKYEWRVDCEDAYGNEASESSYFSVELEEESEDDYEYVNIDDVDRKKDQTRVDQKPDYNNETQAYTTEITKARESLNEYGANEKKIAATLGMETKLSAAEKSARELEEELFKLRDELSSQEFLEEKEQKLKILESSKQNTIKKISITSSQEIVPQKNPQLIKSYSQSTAKDKKASATTATAKEYQVQATYFSGKTAYYTFVVHKSETGENMLISIPSSVSESSKDIVSPNTYKVVKEGTVIEFTADPNKEITYYVPKSIAESELAKIEYVMIKAPSASGATSISGMNIKTISTQVSGYWHYILIVMLGIVYVLYTFDVGDKIKVAIKKKKAAHNPKVQKNTIESVLTDLSSIKNEKDMVECERRYNNIMIQYEGLTKEEKKAVYEEAIKAYYVLLEKKMDYLMEQIESHMENDDMDSARLCQSEIEHIYANLPEDLKHKLKHKKVLAQFSIEHATHHSQALEEA